MYWLYQTILYQPLYNALIFLYNIIPGHDIGLAIIGLTILIKLVLYPLSAQALKSQKSLQELQPKIDEIRKKFKDEKEKQAAEIMRIYKENKVNPFSSCLPLLIQLPFLIAVYQVFRVGLNNGGHELLYSFIQNPGIVNNLSFGFIDLAKSNWMLAVLAAASQYLQTKMMPSAPKPAVKSDGAKDENMMGDVNRSMLYIMPVMTLFIGLSLPGGLTLYWFVTTILTVLQQKLLFKRADKLVSS
jgi:YidC/Oxa1 family membrane protein insertase